MSIYLIYQNKNRTERVETHHVSPHMFLGQRVPVISLDNGAQVRSQSSANSKLNEERSIEPSSKVFCSTARCRAPCHLPDFILSKTVNVAFGPF